MSNLSNKQILKNMENFTGKNVIIVGEHPHSGKKGKTVKGLIPDGFLHPVMLVKLDSGLDCYANHDNLFFITQIMPVNNRS